MFSETALLDDDLHTHRSTADTAVTILQPFYLFFTNHKSCFFENSTRCLPQRYVSVGGTCRWAERSSAAAFVAAAVSEAAAVCLRSHPAPAADTGELVSGDRPGRLASIDRCHAAAPPSVARRRRRRRHGDGDQTAGADRRAPVAQVHAVDLRRQLP